MVHKKNTIWVFNWCPVAPKISYRAIQNEQRNNVSVNFISSYYSHKTRKKEIERQLNINLTWFYFPKK